MQHLADNGWSGNPSAKLLLVEDERELAGVVARHLEREGFVVRSLADGQSALRALADSSFDLVILDVMLPLVDGLEIARRLRAGTPRMTTGTTVPILMLTARNEESDRVMGLELGADDYLAKPFGLRELVARVRALLRRSGVGREPVETKTQLSVGHIRVDAEARAVFIGTSSVDLTPREYDLLVILAGHPGRTFSRDYLLERIWGPSFEGSDRVVDTTIVRLRRKLAAEGERVVSVWGVGYRLDP
jgi:DNA-binding response OmpR family regulator